MCFGGLVSSTRGSWSYVTLNFVVISSVTPGHHKIAQKGKRKGWHYNSYVSEEHALRS